MALISMKGEEKMSDLNQRIDFYVSAYLKVNPDDLIDIKQKEVVERIIKKCSDKAYSDLQRRMPYRYSTEKIKALEIDEQKDFSNLKTEFQNEIYGIILDNMVDETGMIDSEHMEPRKLIEKILKIKNKYISLFRDGEEFTVGLAQKWVNMTLKYLWILGVLDDEYEDKLETPIDSYIIKVIVDELKINMKHIKWSSWDDFDEYSRIQDELYDILLDKGYTRIGWENQCWIEESLKG